MWLGAWRTPGKEESKQDTACRRMGFVTLCHSIPPSTAWLLRRCPASIHAMLDTVNYTCRIRIDRFDCPMSGHAPVRLKAKRKDEPTCEKHLKASSITGYSAIDTEETAAVDLKTRSHEQIGWGI